MLDVRVWPRLETDQTELRKLMANSGCRQLGVLELCKWWKAKSRQAVSQKQDRHARAN